MAAETYAVFVCEKNGVVIPDADVDGWLAVPRTAHPEPWVLRVVTGSAMPLAYTDGSGDDFLIMPSVYDPFDVIVEHPLMEATHKQIIAARERAGTVVGALNAHVQ